jgi:hypothetical protein
VKTHLTNKQNCIDTRANATNVLLAVASYAFYRRIVKCFLQLQNCFRLFLRSVDVILEVSV